MKTQYPASSWLPSPNQALPLHRHLLLNPKPSWNPLPCPVPALSPPGDSPRFGANPVGAATPPRIFGSPRRSRGGRSTRGTGLRNTHHHVLDYGVGTTTPVFLTCRYLAALTTAPSLFLWLL